MREISLKEYQFISGGDGSVGTAVQVPAVTGNVTVDTGLSCVVVPAASYYTGTLNQYPLVSTPSAPTQSYTPPTQEPGLGYSGIPFVNGGPIYGAINFIFSWL